MILPAFGIISQVIPAFARKALFGYASISHGKAPKAWSGPCRARRRSIPSSIRRW